MGDEAAFLAALREKPDDDTARLAYADWLDEYGLSERAEYVRLCVQTARASERARDLARRLDLVWLEAYAGLTAQQHELLLYSGRLVWLRTLKQRNIYEGLGDRLPTEQDNRDFIRGLVARETGERGGHVPYLIDPEARPLRWGGTNPDWYFRPGAPVPAFLPEIACVGRFTSRDPNSGEDGRASSLVVIWFQDEFAFPINPVVRERIRAIDWEAHAVTFVYRR